jgi:hypothetical protein
MPFAHVAAGVVARPVEEDVRRIIRANRHLQIGLVGFIRIGTVDDVDVGIGGFKLGDNLFVVLIEEVIAVEPEIEHLPFAGGRNASRLGATGCGGRGGAGDHHHTDGQHHHKTDKTLKHRETPFFLHIQIDRHSARNPNGQHTYKG